VVIRYESRMRTGEVFHAVTRVAKLTMKGVTDFSVFEQEGANFSEIGAIHAESSGGRLRFWFDPQGELYAICDEAELEEVSRPEVGRPSRAGMNDWTFQADTREVPEITWLLDHLDRAGLPCVWREVKPSLHPAVQWSGHLIPASAYGVPRTGGLLVQAYVVDGGFGISLRTSGSGENGAGHLLMVLAEIIARHFPGTCLAGNHVMERNDWLDETMGWSSQSAG